MFAMNILKFSQIEIFFVRNLQESLLYQKYNNKCTEYITHIHVSAWKHQALNP